MHGLAIFPHQLRSLFVWNLEACIAFQMSAGQILESCSAILFHIMTIWLLYCLMSLMAMDWCMLVVLSQADSFDMLSPEMFLKFVHFPFFNVLIITVVKKLVR